MALIVVCEDDAATRALITAVLSKAGHDVESFDNGLAAYVRLLDGDAELLISDVQMPFKNGFELIADIRQESELVDLPCILLTSLQERAHMRIGMTSGADDYVTKPFQPSELLEAVDSQLKRSMQRYVEQMRHVDKSVNRAVGERTNELMEIYEKRLRTELQARWARTDMSTVQLHGSLLVCSFLEVEAWQRSLPQAQMAELVKLYFSKLSDCAALFQADHVQFVGHSLLVVFDDSQDTPSVNHRTRTLRLLQSLSSIRASMQAHVQQLPASAGAPSFMPCIVAHRDFISLTKLEGIAGGMDQMVPVGQALGDMAKLLKTAQALRWPLAVSDASWSELQQGLHSDEQVQIKLNAKPWGLIRASLPAA